MLKENMLAPDFELPDESGVTRKLSDYRGKDLVLYFYPKDGTSGCTTEACNFRDNYSAYEKRRRHDCGGQPGFQQNRTPGSRPNTSYRSIYLLTQITRFVSYMRSGGRNKCMARSTTASCVLRT